VIGFARDNRDRVTLVSFDETINAYLIVDDHDIGPRNDSPRRIEVHQMRRRSLLSFDTTAKVFSRVRLSRILCAASRTLLRTLRGNATNLRKQVQVEGRPTRLLWDPRLHDKLLLIEVPSGSAHRDYLRRLMASDSSAVIFYVHDLIAIRNPEFFDAAHPERTQAWFLGYVSLVASSHQVFANSYSTARDFDLLFQLLKPSRPPQVSVVYPPSFHTHIERERNIAVANRTGDQKTISLLGVGVPDVRKNFSVVVLAMPILRKMGFTPSFSIVASATDGPICAALQELVLSLGETVTLYSDADDKQLSRLYASHDVVVVPSRAEGFGLPIVEASAHGCPVVASEIPVFVELADLLPIRLADPDNPSEWALRIAETVESPHQMMTMPSEFVADWTTLADAILKPIE